MKCPVASLLSCPCFLQAHAAPAAPALSVPGACSTFQACALAALLHRKLLSRNPQPPCLPPLLLPLKKLTTIFPTVWFLFTCLLPVRTLCPGTWSKLSVTIVSRVRALNVTLCEAREVVGAGPPWPSMWWLGAMGLPLHLVSSLPRGMQGWPNVKRNGVDVWLRAQWHWAVNESRQRPEGLIHGPAWAFPILYTWRAPTSAIPGVQSRGEGLWPPEVTVN